MCPRPQPRLQTPSIPPPLPSPPIASPAEKRAALASHRSLTRSLANVKRALKTGSTDATHLESLLSTANKDLGTIADYLSASFEPVYYNEFIPDNSTAAPQRAFAVPELFELILDYLPIPSILVFSQTCKDYHARIQHSEHLQTTLSLRAAPPSSHFRAPFEDCLLGAPGGDFHCRPPRNEGSIFPSSAPDGKGPAGLHIGAKFVPQGPEQRLPKIGSTYRRMFLTQPPITKLKPVARLCCFSTGSEPLHRESGITIGDLYDFYRDAIEKHRWCPGSPQRATIVESGQNRVQPTIYGRVALGDRDPMVLRYERAKQQRREEGGREGMPRTKDEAYLEEKWIGEYIRRGWQSADLCCDMFTDLLAFPTANTMPEWLARNPNWDAGNWNPVR